MGIVLDGITPCSRALLILVLARVMEHFWLGVVATLAMAAGTALTVSLLAILSQRAQHLAWRLLQRRNGIATTCNKLSMASPSPNGILLILLGLTLMSTPAHSCYHAKPKNLHLAFVGSLLPHKLDRTLADQCDRHFSRLLVGKADPTALGVG